ncbi:unnamed protein product [Mytilus edulis]|uniref:Uncharacterized protein n=1 Tax=Mytilus edulis TaxID=6550 RepID=A0A8S3RFD5_MYTED|nr:unnamed protein product [Mytilus edulis]
MLSTIQVFIELQCIYVVECKQGTKSKNEEPCTPCNTGTYGRKCTFSASVAFMKADVTEEEKYVYFTGFGGFLLIILSAVCIYVCFRKYKSKQLDNNHITEPDNNQSNEESSTENVYEIIDESSIFDESIPSTNPAESIEDVKIRNLDPKHHPSILDILILTQHLLNATRRTCIVHEYALTIVAVVCLLCHQV